MLTLISAVTHGSIGESKAAYGRGLHDSNPDVNRRVLFHGPPPRRQFACEPLGQRLLHIHPPIGMSSFHLGDEAIARRSFWLGVDLMMKPQQFAPVRLAGGPGLNVFEVFKSVRQFPAPP